MLLRLQRETLIKSTETKKIESTTCLESKLEIILTLIYSHILRESALGAQLDALN